MAIPTEALARAGATEPGVRQLGHTQPPDARLKALCGPGAPHLAQFQMATAQLAALSPIHTIAPHLSQHACEQLMGVEHERQQVWQAWLRRLDRLDTSYKD